TFLAISLGSMFLLLFQHITMGHWGIVVRRTHETFATGVVVIAIFVVPLMYLHLDDLYPWAPFWRESQQHHEESGGAHEGGVQHSQADESLVGASIAHAQDRGEPAAAHHAAHTPEHAAHEATMTAKLGYLNPQFFWIRLGIYLAIWIR